MVAKAALGREHGLGAGCEAADRLCQLVWKHGNLRTGWPCWSGARRRGICRGRIKPWAGSGDPLQALEVGGATAPFPSLGGHSPPQSGRPDQRLLARPFRLLHSQQPSRMCSGISKILRTASTAAEWKRLEPRSTAGRWSPWPNSFNAVSEAVDNFGPATASLPCCG
jgi:hypothetical protein